MNTRRASWRRCSYLLNYPDPHISTRNVRKLFGHLLSAPRLHADGHFLTQTTVGARPPARRRKRHHLPPSNPTKHLPVFSQPKCATKNRDDSRAVATAAHLTDWPNCLRLVHDCVWKKFGAQRQSWIACHVVLSRGKWDFGYIRVFFRTFLIKLLAASEPITSGKKTHKILHTL